MIEKGCGQCGSPLSPRRPQAKYCSRECTRKNNGGRNIGFQTWWINSKGYREGRILTAQGVRNVKHHRFVMECKLGRRLLPHEDVHHINGIKDDNREENLAVLTHGDHSQITNSERVYRKGYKMNLTDEQRQDRACRFSEVGKQHGKANLIKAREAKARGEAK